MSLTIPKESAWSTLLVDAVECIERELIKWKQTQESFFQGEKNYGMISRLPWFIDIVDVFSSMGILLIKGSSKNNGVADTVWILHTHTMKFIPLPRACLNIDSVYSDLYFWPISVYQHTFAEHQDVLVVSFYTGEYSFMLWTISDNGTINWWRTDRVYWNTEDYLSWLTMHLLQQDQNVKTRVHEILH